MAGYHRNSTERCGAPAERLQRGNQRTCASARLNELAALYFLLIKWCLKNLLTPCWSLSVFAFLRLARRCMCSLHSCWSARPHTLTIHWVYCQLLPSDFFVCFIFYYMVSMSCPRQTHNTTHISLVIFPRKDLPDTVFLKGNARWSECRLNLCWEMETVNWTDIYLWKWDVIWMR